MKPDFTIQYTAIDFNSQAWNNTFGEMTDEEFQHLHLYFSLGKKTVTIQGEPLANVLRFWQKYTGESICTSCSSQFHNFNMRLKATYDKSVHMRNLKEKANIEEKSASNKCGFCEKDIDDKKKFCNKACYHLSLKK